MKKAGTAGRLSGQVSWTPHKNLDGEEKRDQKRKTDVEAVSRETEKSLKRCKAGCMKDELDSTYDP